MLIYKIVVGRHYRESHTNVSIYTLTPFPSSTFDGRGVCGMWRRGRSSAYLLLLRRAGPHLSSRNGTGTSKKDAAPSTVAAMRGFNAVNILFPNSWMARPKISGIYTLPGAMLVLTGNAAPNRLRTTVLAASADAATGKYASTV